MKYVFRVVMFHIVCLIYFGIIYLTCKDDFVTVMGKPIDSLDCIFLSIAIQSGVGDNTLMPLTPFSKIVIMLQEVVMLTTNVFLLYFIVNL